MNCHHLTRFSSRSRLTVLRSSPFTVIELLLVISILAILFLITIPIMRRAQDQARFTRWFSYNRGWSNDQDCVLNFNFQDSDDAITRGVLRNSADGVNIDNYDRKYYDGYLRWIDRPEFDFPTPYTDKFVSSNGVGGKAPYPHNFKSVNSGGRFCRYKRALQFDGSTTYIDVPATQAIDFTPEQEFTVCLWVKFDKMRLGDGIFSKSLWGTQTDAACQYDVYCDPTSGASGEGSIEVDIFTACFGWDNGHIDISGKKWHNIVLRYRADGNTIVHHYEENPETGEMEEVDFEIDGETQLWVDGKLVSDNRETNNSVAPKWKDCTEFNVHFIIGAIGAWRKYWHSSSLSKFPNEPVKVIFPFQGVIDEFLFFKRALTNAEIIGMYDMGRNGTFSN